MTVKSKGQGSTSFGRQVAKAPWYIQANTHTISVPRFVRTKSQRTKHEAQNVYCHCDSRIRMRMNPAMQLRKMSVANILHTP
jgi:hypothetical protein